MYYCYYGCSTTTTVVYTTTTTATTPITTTTTILLLPLLLLLCASARNDYCCGQLLFASYVPCVCLRLRFGLQGAENWEKLRTAILANSDVAVPEYYLKQFHACEGTIDSIYLILFNRLMRVRLKQVIVSAQVHACEHVRVLLCRAAFLQFHDAGGLVGYPRAY